MEIKKKLDEFTALMDRDHAEIHALFGKIKSFNCKEFDRRIVGDVLAKTIRKTHLHFIAEENFFCNSRYNERELHRLEHRNFAYFLDGFYLKLNACKIDDLTPLIEYIEHWENEHKRVFDKNLFEYVASEFRSDIILESTTH